MTYISYHSNLLVNEIQDMSALKCFFFLVLRLVNLQTHLATWRGLCKNATCGYLRLLTSPFGQGLRLSVEKNIVLFKHYFMGGRRGGLVVCALDSGASTLGSGPGRGHCVVFLGTTSTLVYK